MLLAIDIGNSNVVLGGYLNSQWKKVWRMPTIREEESQVFYERRIQELLLEEALLFQSVRKVVISSVVPELSGVFERLSGRLFGTEPVMVRPELFPQLEVRTGRPGEIGTDLFANAVAARHLYHFDAIVVDFGTALTFTTVSASEGAILGVSIAPGLQTAINALFTHTAQLPEVPLVLPDKVLGKNTTHAIQSGVMLGYIGLVRHMLREIRKEAGPDFRAIGTGGLASVLTPLAADFHLIDPNLTLNGLRIIGEFVG